MASSSPLRSVQSKKQDGRHARSDRSRDAIIQAAIDGMRERDEAPVVEDLAERAGVSRRTFFRLFSDIGSLYVAINEQVRVEVMKKFPFPAAGLSLRDAIDATVDQRASVYAYVRPMRRITDRLASTKPEIVRITLQGDRQLLKSLRVTFADHVDSQDDDTWHSLAWLTSWASWNYLTDVRGLSNKRARAAIRDSIERLLNA